MAPFLGDGRSPEKEKHAARSEHGVSMIGGIYPEQGKEDRKREYDSAYGTRASMMDG